MADDNKTSVQALAQKKAELDAERDAATKAAEDRKPDPSYVPRRAKAPPLDGPEDKPKGEMMEVPGLPPESKMAPDVQRHSEHTQAEITAGKKASDQWKARHAAEIETGQRVASVLVGGKK